MSGTDRKALLEELGKFALAKHASMSWIEIRLLACHADGPGFAVGLFLSCDAPRDLQALLAADLEARLMRRSRIFLHRSTSCDSYVHASTLVLRSSVSAHVLVRSLRDVGRW